MTIAIPEEITADERSLREDLLGRVDAIRETLERTAPLSEEAGYLLPEAVAALDASGLLRMKAARELGGFEAPPATQFLVLVELAQIDASTAWNATVNNNSSGFLSAFLPDEAIAEIAPDGVIPIAAGVAPPMGTAVEVDGGYRLRGRWRTCSGVTQARWLRLSAVVEGAGTVFCIVDKDEVTVHADSWDVVGLRATGSFDVSADEVFVPHRRAFSQEQQYRGGPQYRLRGLAASSYEHAAIGIGIGRRAISEYAKLSAVKGKATEPMLTDLGRYATRLEAVATAAQTTYEHVYRVLSDPDSETTGLGLQGQAMAALATDVAVDCVEAAFRHAGTAALYRPNPFERLLRDVHGATQHVAVSHLFYRELGERLVEQERA
jgi:indole-3-acetate monooxygenase